MAMVPAIAIVGESGSGKTDLVERLIVELKKRGKRIAVVKHCHEEVKLDKEGTDSWRFFNAGSDITVASSSNSIAVNRKVDADTSIAEILRFIGGSVDLVIFEGYKKGKIPKIEVHREQVNSNLACPVEVLSAVATDSKLDIDIPQLPLNDTAQIADFIEANLLGVSENDTLLFVNGQQIFIKSFVKDIISEAILAMINTLKGADDIKNLDISIMRKNSDA
jgi:molybdopterin-guanine dinucleotide biosynthesis protein MobB